MQNSMVLKSREKAAIREERRKLPTYCKGEELFNAITHIVGGGLGLIFAAIAFAVVSHAPTVNKYIAVSVYSLSIVVLYTMSALYHFLPVGKAKRVFRVFDHCTIYLLIAGCFTPFCLITLWSQPMGKIILAVEWGTAIIGITFNAINMHWKAVKILSYISYVVMGWLALVMLPTLLREVSLLCVSFLLAGGVAYTVGLIFFALGKKHKYMHSIWHLFVLLGTIFQFVSVLCIL